MNFEEYGGSNRDLSLTFEAEPNHNLFKKLVAITESPHCISIMKRV